MKQLWWILCNIGIFLIIRSAYVQMNGLDRWLVVLWMSLAWLNYLLDDAKKYLEAA